MKKVLFFVITSIFLWSCDNDIQENTEDLQKLRISKVLEKAKDLHKNADLADYYKSKITNPDWSKVDIMKDVQDTVLMTVPINNGIEDEKWTLIISDIKNNTSIGVARIPLKNGQIIESDEFSLLTSSKTVFCTKIDKNSDEAEISLRTSTCPDGSPAIVQNGDGSFSVSNCKTGFPEFMLPEIIVIGNGGNSSPNQVYTPDTIPWWLSSISATFGGGTGGTGGGSNGTSEEIDTESMAPYQMAENIIKSPDVIDAVAKIWEKVKKDASAEKGRREWGAWIYYQSSTGKYYVGTERPAPEYVKGGVDTKGTITTWSPSKAENGSHIPKDAVQVSFFHCHTPLTYEPGTQRLVGPSRVDMKLTKAWKMDVIVYDYVGNNSKNKRSYIYGGHKLDDPAQFYIVKHQTKKKKK